MNADKMFKKSGFPEIEKEYNYIKYKNVWGRNGYIRFEIEEKTVCAYTTMNGMEFIRSITMEELQAINQKCKELGWLDEK